MTKSESELMIENRQLRERVAALEEALQMLVELKDYKDIKGKDELYSIRQPKAWEQARAALTGEK